MTTQPDATVSESPVEVPDAFHVHDEATANWVVRKIVEARRYAERVQAWADAELRRAKREEEFFLYRFGGQLEQWTREELAKQRGRKSICLPAGQVGFRLRPARLDILDEQAMLLWCKGNLPVAIVIRESVAKTVLMAHVQKTGEIPAGAVIAGGNENFYLK